MDRLDRDGEPEFLRINLLCRSSFFNGSVDDWEKLYPALKEFMKILQECSIVFKNKPGINKSTTSSSHHDTADSDKIPVQYIVGVEVHTRYFISEAKS